MFDKDLLSLLNNGKISLADAQEIRARRQKRRERYDEKAINEGIAIKGIKEQDGKNVIFVPMNGINHVKRYKKPALKKANILKTSHTTEINPNFSLDLAYLERSLKEKIEKSL